MKLLRLGTNGFGGLRGFFRFDPDRLAVVVDDNERGKTTLLAALVAALYGLEDDRRTHRVLTPRERWRPWQGPDYDVEIEVECGGERYVVTRDFARSTVAIRNGAGKDVAAEFRDGKDDYPVGRKLLGLDADEFEKCAFVRQGDLGLVVSGDEKERRASSLRGKLEAAADSRVGDASATCAANALDIAVRRYDCPEIEFTGTVDNAIGRLEAKEALIETELRTLEHDFAGIAAPLDQLAELGEREHETRTALGEIEVARHTRLAGEARLRLEEHHGYRAEYEALREEAVRLEACAGIPPDAESQLRETVAKLQSAEGKLADLEKSRREELARQRRKVEEELDSLGGLKIGTVADADHCVTLSAELRRMTSEDARLGDEIFQLREALAGEGHDRERLEWLSHRLGGLAEQHEALLRRQSEVALAHQTEVAGLENQRTVSSETLREIDAQRNAWTLPGWFLLALGFSGILAGVVVVVLQGLPVLSTIFFVAGALMLGTGVALVTMGRQLRDDEREDALRKLSEAQRRLGALRQRRAETESELEALAREMGYRDHVELLKEWSELARLRQESAPTLKAQHQLVTMETRRQQAMEEARTLVARFGDLPCTPEQLEELAPRLRRAEALRHQLATMDRSWPWMEEQKRVDEAAAEGFRERAQRILQAAGLTHDPTHPWEDLFRDLADRARGQQRHATLVGELIPAAERRLLPPDEVAELESRLALVEASSGAPEPEAAETGRPAFEIEEQDRSLRERFDALQRRRADLRVEVEGIARRYHDKHPETQAQLVRVREAIARARRFRDAVEIASGTIRSVSTETHRRWAEHLNQRVGELLGGVGANIEQVRFGDDLDFSVKLSGGQWLPRGKADQQLSCATRDQLYLAVRLAIGEFLSRGRSPLPLLLDDVFATSDDERARAGMRTLLDRFAGHQIILMTCHRQRYERLAELDRDLYAERVQWLDTRPAGAPR